MYGMNLTIDALLEDCEDDEDDDLEDLWRTRHHSSARTSRRPVPAPDPIIYMGEV